MADIAQLTALIEPEAKALGFNLVRVKMIGGDDVTLQVMAERPETRQLTIDDCAALSRRISDKFDEVDPIEEAYRLEVSSPGIDRPLTRVKDYTDWAGHEARLTLVEKVDGRRVLKGIIEGADGDTIRLSDPKSGDVAVDFANIESGKLVLTDRLIAASVPLSAEGADEFEAIEEDD